MTTTDRIRAALTDAARAIGVADPPEPLLERPRDPAHGDLATNLAMMLARPLRRKPLEIAEALRAQLDLGEAGVSAVDIAPPGFMNFRLSTATVASAIPTIIAAGRNYGRQHVGEGRIVNIEFVSANPTGPLHVGHGRQAALGDAIATLLEWTGWKVSREFYYNDAGVQIENLAKSVWVRVGEVLGVPGTIPEGGYHGEYIREIAEAYVAARGDSLSAGVFRRSNNGGSEQTDLYDHALLDDMRHFAVAAMRAEQDRDLQALGVSFQTYYLESSLYTDGLVDKTVQMLESAGHAYESEGALWLRTTEYGDDKDRVMRKRDGTYTYFLPDVAYHVTKWERGYRRAIDVQGADHHSTVVRVRAGLQALDMGIPQGYPEYVLHQMVTVMKSGEEVKISKRAGSYVTVRDLVDQVGRNAVRYFFLMRKSDSQLVFDVDLALAQSEENPVYYIQMAHARMCGIFRVGGIDPLSIEANDIDLAVLSAPEEQALLKALADFPGLVAGAAEALEPHRLAAYLLETARLVHGWYHKHHVLNEPEAIMGARLALARASQIVLENGLTILGIEAPERM
jgi:arginyl-tRNA synthetase